MQYAQTIGILTSGGDCPGLNAAIRGVARAAYQIGDALIIGIAHGFLGLIEGKTHVLCAEDVAGILAQGGTILGTSREKPFRSEPGVRDTVAGRSRPEAIRETYRRLGLDALVVLGGNGTMKTAALLARQGLSIVGLPKTIDNDLQGTDATFGFDSAVGIATDAIDRLHSTAEAHNRVMVVEVMGHDAGWLALYAGVAGGADVILIPEIPYSVSSIVEHLAQRHRAGREYAVVVVAEGAFPADAPLFDGPDGAEALERSAGYRAALAIHRATGRETRVTVLGYQQRGGTPSPRDRILATRFGTAAAEYVFRRETGVMIALEDDRVVSRPLEEIAGKLRLVPPAHPLLRSARLVGTCFGD